MFLCNGHWLPLLCFWQNSLISLAGFPYEVLESAHYVPGNDRGDCSRYKQKPLWGEIMKITDSVCCLYGGRVHNDFMRKVDKDSSRKAKASEKMLPHFSTLPWICSVKIYIVDDYKVSSSELFNLFFLASLLPENAPAEPWRAPRANGHSLPLVLVAPQDSQHDGSQQHPTLGQPCLIMGFLVASVGFWVGDSISSNPCFYHFFCKCFGSAGTTKTPSHFAMTDPVEIVTGSRGFPSQISL